MHTTRAEVDRETGSAITAMPAINGLPVLEFTKIEQFTTFRAEFAFDGDDIVFHFFLPPELVPHTNTREVRKYWLETFPKVFEPVVIDVFKVQPPRIQAKYISDMDLDSWWFRAFGFASTLSPDALCAKLCETLDQALEATKNTK
jgi:hypothetical protein